MAANGIVRFGVFEVDLGARELRKRGIRVRLQEQPFRVLAALLEKPGEVVTREQLKDRLWAQDEFVEFDKSLNTAIQKIRQALGDSAESPRFLETAPKVGYRFVAPIEVAPTESPTTGDEPVGASEPSSMGSGLRVALAAALAGAVVGGLFMWITGDEKATSRHRRYPLALEATGAGLSQGRSPAISPDGSKIAYVSDEEPPRLWLYHFDSGESEPLDGTEEARAIFWAPDSAAIGFSAEGAIKRVPVSGEAPTTVCALSGASTNSSGTWSHDGRTIVFSAGTGGGQSLYSVTAAGGSPETIFESGIRNTMKPRFLPGDSRVLVEDFNETSPGLRDTYVFDLRTLEHTLLLSDATDAIYSPTGHLIYHREGALWAASFSVDGTETTGSPIRIGDSLDSPTVSEDGTLVSITRAAEASRLELVLRDRTGARLRSIGSPLLGATHPSVSPDGRFVAVSGSKTRGAPNDIWVYAMDGSAERRITSDSRYEDEPLWTPDGGRILFRMQTGSDRNADFYIVSADGSGEVQPLTQSDVREAEPDWSPDGKRLLYQVRSSTTAGMFDLQLAAVDQAGRLSPPKPFLATEFNEGHGQFSPKGDYVAYTSPASGERRIYVCKAPDCRPVNQAPPLGALRLGGVPTAVNSTGRGGLADRRRYRPG